MAMKWRMRGSPSNPLPTHGTHGALAELDWALRCVSQRGRMWKRFSVWHSLWLLDSLSEDASSLRSAFALSETPQGWAEDCGSCSLVPSQLGQRRVVVLVPTGSDLALELRGRDFAHCQAAPTAPKGMGVLVAPCEAEVPPWVQLALAAAWWLLPRLLLGLSQKS